MISKIYKCLHVLTKTLPFKFIGVALWLLNSQWKMHHCDVLCLVLSSLCSLQAYNYAEHLYNEEYLHNPQQFYSTSFTDVLATEANS